MAQQVTAPRRQARQGGIRSIVGEYVIEPRLVLAAGTGGLAWEDTGCGLPSETKAGCFDPAPQVDKDAEGPALYTTIEDPFALYKGVECFIGGDDEGASYEQQALSILDAGEDRGIEAKLVAWAEAAPDTATAGSIVEAIGAADQYADNTYTHLPVIIISRADADAAKAAGVIEWRDGRFVTGNGTPVLATGKATSGTVSVIGWPEVYVSAAKSYQGLDKTANTALAIAERLYAIGVDCDFRYTVTVSAP